MKPVSSCYSPKAPETFKITYLKPIFHQPSHTGGGRTTKVEVVTECVGDLLNHYRCALYLHFRYPTKSFTCEEVERCLEILSLAVRKTTHIEWMEENIFNICYDTYYVNYGTFSYKRRMAIGDIMNPSLKRLNFACYNVNRQDEPEWSNKETRQQLYPEFTFEQLMQNDEDFQIYKRFWKSIPDHQMVRNILQIWFPKDIINKIICYTVKPHSVGYGEDNKSWSEIQNDFKNK